jgi:hypothetical protein
MKLHITALAIVATLAATAGAQPKPARRARPAAAAKKESAAPPKKARFYDFTGDNIDGDRIRPDGTTIFGLNAARHGNLIKLRGDFVREIVKSADRL